MNHLHNVLSFTEQQKNAFKANLSNLIVSQFDAIREKNKDGKASLLESISVSTSPTYITTLQGQLKSAHINQVKECILGNIIHCLEVMSDKSIDEQLGYLIFTAPTEVVFKFTDNGKVLGCNDIEDLVVYYSRIIEAAMAETLSANK